VATFTHFFPAAAIQWIINPGQVAYNLLASKKRLEASEQQDRAVVLETTRAAAVQYYDLMLNQAQVSVAWQAIKEAEELLRRGLKAGTALPADELRAKADLALKQQNLLTALNGFYDASVALTVTLDLDPTVMLVPRAGTVRQATLVREHLPIDDMLVTAVRYRPDLEAVRTLLAATEADKGATMWGWARTSSPGDRRLGTQAACRTAG
jgi:outer membrane protein TolC